MDFQDIQRLQQRLLPAARPERPHDVVILVVLLEDLRFGIEVHYQLSCFDNDPQSYNRVGKAVCRKFVGRGVPRRRQVLRTQPRQLSSHAEFCVPEHAFDDLVAFSSRTREVGHLILAPDGLVEINLLERLYLLSFGHNGQNVVVFELVDMNIVAVDERLHSRAVLDPGDTGVPEQAEKFDVHIMGIRISLVGVSELQKQTKTAK